MREESLDGIWIADGDDADDGGIGRGVLDVEARTSIGVLVEHFDDVEEGADFVLRKMENCLTRGPSVFFGGSGAALWQWVLICTSK